MRHKIALAVAVVLATIVAAASLAVIVSVPFATPAHAASPVVVEQVNLCDLSAFLTKLDANGGVVVSIFPATAYATNTDESFCPCGNVAAPCLLAKGWHVVSVYVVHKSP